jgi:hypothetical protein
MAVTDEVVQRLRASKLEYDEQQFQFGREAGCEWASKLASAEDLVRLSDFRDSTRDWVSAFEPNGQPPYKVAEWFVLHVLNAARKIAPEQFWENFRDSEETGKVYPLFVRGFAEGALEVWDAVKAQL